MTQIHDYDPKNGTLVAAKGEMPSLLIPDLSSEQTRLVDQYLCTGKNFGLLWSLPYLSNLIVREEHLELAKKFAELERAYYEMGFRPISLVGFRDLAGYNRHLQAPDGVCCPLKEGESPVFASAQVIRVLTELKLRRQTDNGAA